MKYFSVEQNIKDQQVIISIIGELAYRLFGLSTEEELNILRDNVKRLNTAMNTTLQVQKIQPSVANYKKIKLRPYPRKSQEQSTQLII